MDLRTERIGRSALLGPNRRTLEGMGHKDSRMGRFAPKNGYTGVRFLPVFAFLGLKTRDLANAKTLSHPAVLAISSMDGVGPPNLPVISSPCVLIDVKALNWGFDVAIRPSCNTSLAVEDRGIHVWLVSAVHLGWST